MKCPRCQDVDLHHNIGRVSSLSCHICGFISYAGFPLRTIDEHEAMLKEELQRIRADVIASGLAGEPDDTVKYCAQCHEVEIPVSRTYCDACQKLRDREAVARWQAAHPDKLKEYRRKSAANQTAKRRKERQRAEAAVG
jgi:hypothetical protein